MKNNIDCYVSQCETCTRVKHCSGLPTGKLNPLEVPTERWEVVGLDFITDLPLCKGKNAILMVINHLSKQLYAIPTNMETDSKETAGATFDNVFLQEGLPQKLVSDRDTRFTSDFTRELYKVMGVKQNLSMAYHPQTDGQTERANQEIHAYMRIFVDYHQDDWVDVLPKAVFSYNTKLQSAIGTLPFEMAKGRQPNRGTEPAKKTKYLNAEQFAKHMRLVADEAQAHLEIAKRDMARHYDVKHKAEEFEVGDKVYVSTKDLSTGRPKKKWDVQRIGPCAITKKLSSHAYQVLLPRNSRIHPVFHVSKLTRWISDEFNRPKPPRVVLNVRGGDWIPEKVLQSQTNKGRLEYQTKWRDQPDSQTTWELVGCNAGKPAGITS
jgi:hypothetical protein